jgi:hypothetical protein
MTPGLVTLLLQVVMRLIQFVPQAAYLGPETAIRGFERRCGFVKKGECVCQSSFTRRRTDVWL